MKFFVYIILDQKREKYYIEQTNDVVRRFSQHNDKTRLSWTSKYGPWTLVHSEICKDRPEAMRKERHLKSLKNKDRIREYIASQSLATYIYSGVEE